MFLFLFIWIWYNDQNQENYFKQAIEFKTWKFDLKAILQMVKLGVPSSVQNMFEVGAFSFASTLVARLSSEAAAANQFVLNVASTTFMFPLGLSVAVGSLVGQRMGANDVDGALKMGRKGFKVTVAMMGFFGVLLYLFPTQIMGFYTKDLKVIELSLQVVVLVSLFQIFDGLQVVATGALRGTGNTLISALINCLGHWGVGVPLGYYLCFVQGRGLLGVWTGLAIGLMVVAIALLVAWRWRSRVLLRTRSL
jgi:MATE family multidrug resistance protein